MKEATEERKSIKEISEKAVDVAEDNKMKVQNLTDKVTQFQEKTNVEFKQQMKINDTHEKLLANIAMS